MADPTGIIVGAVAASAAGGIGWLAAGRLRDTTDGAIATGALAMSITEQLRAVNEDLREQVAQLTRHVRACDDLTAELRLRVAALEAPTLEI